MTVSLVIPSNVIPVTIFRKGGEILVATVVASIPDEECELLETCELLICRSFYGAFNGVKCK